MKQKHIIDIQRIKRKESKHTTTENHQITREKRKKEKTTELQNTKKTSNQMVIVSPYRIWEYVICNM